MRRRHSLEHIRASYYYHLHILKVEGTLNNRPARPAQVIRNSRGTASAQAIVLKPSAKHRHDFAFSSLFFIFLYFLAYGSVCRIDSR